MARFLLATRYLIIFPILGLALAAAFFFVFGGIGLFRFLGAYLLTALGMAKEPLESGEGVVIFQVVEYVHTFLIGTVLYITALGFFQLFIKEIDFPSWLKVESTEELETNLIGVTVVVLAVNFMGAILVRGTGNLLDYGAGIALPIAALGLFVGLRTWSNRAAKKAEASTDHQKPATAAKTTSQ